MARWRRSFIREVMPQLARLGLSACLVCGGSDQRMLARPRVVHVGGAGPRGWFANPDDDETIEYLIAVRCFLCGHQLLFSSEQFRHGTDAILIRGVSEEQEARDEEGGG